MFAGPNGSGKTTVKETLQRPAAWFGIDINPDVLEKQIRETGQLSLLAFSLDSSREEIRDFFSASTLAKAANLSADSKKLDYQEGIIDFTRIEFNSYHASVLSDFLRRKALSAKQSFTFETVMSHEDKIELLKDAQHQGFVLICISSLLTIHRSTLIASSCESHKAATMCLLRKSLNDTYVLSPYCRRQFDTATERISSTPAVANHGFLPNR